MTLMAFIGDHQINSLKRSFDFSADASASEQTIYANPLSVISAEVKERIKSADVLVVQIADRESELDLEETNSAARRYFVPRVYGGFPLAFWRTGAPQEFRNKPWAGWGIYTRTWRCLPQ